MFASVEIEQNVMHDYVLLARVMCDLKFTKKGSKIRKRVSVAICVGGEPRVEEKDINRVPGVSMQTYLWFHD